MNFKRNKNLMENYFTFVDLLFKMQTKLRQNFVKLFYYNKSNSKLE